MLDRFLGWFTGALVVAAFSLPILLALGVVAKAL